VPTPAWAAILFVLIGLALLLTSLVVFALHGAGGCPCGMALFAWLAIVGGAAVWHGARELVRTGKV
jgi:hypothetical protein